MKIQTEVTYARKARYSIRLFGLWIRVPYKIWLHFSREKPRRRNVFKRMVDKLTPRGTDLQWALLVYAPFWLMLLAYIIMVILSLVFGLPHKPCAP